MVETLGMAGAEIQRAMPVEFQWDTNRGDGCRRRGRQWAGHADRQVTTYAKKLAARDAAHRVCGVLDVANNSTIEIPGVGVRMDTDIAHVVRRAPDRDSSIPHDQIQMVVGDGRVTLEGHVVDRWPQRVAAEHMVRHLIGVQGGHEPHSRTAPSVEPNTVRAAIEDAPEHLAEREAERVQISVHDGTTTLAGRVRLWMGKQAVLGTAGHAPGVHGIDDQLRSDATDAP